MLSRRQFLSITVIMLVLLVMFQLTGVMKDYWNDYETNEYAVDELDDDGQAAFSCDFDAALSDEIPTDNKYVVYIGDADTDNTGNIAKIWCQYTKKKFISYPDLNSAEEEIIENCSFLMLDSEYLDFNKDTETLYEWANKGKNMIFSSIPEKDQILENTLLMDLLGIATIYKESVHIKGIDLFEGFLLGGRTIYEAKTEKELKMQDLQLDMPWYGTYANVKRYMIGLVEDGALGDVELEYEDMPSIIWRNNIGKARIFVTYGDYLEDVTALGIYSAMEYEMSEYLIYPVVNAQNVSVVNFAAFSKETDSKMEEEYSRTQNAVFKELILPSLDSIFEVSENKPSFYMNPQLDYSDGIAADGEDLVYYMKLFGEKKAETGLSSLQSSDIDTDSKIKQDMDFYNNIIPEYKFTSIYMDEEDYLNYDAWDSLSELRTVSLEKNRTECPVTYNESGLIIQRTTVDGFDYKYSDDLRVKSIQTALAYSNISVDLGVILYSDEAEDTWEHSSERLASNVVTYWKPFKTFDKTTLTESDGKVRRFLNLDYNDSRKENIITLDIEQFASDADFILRTHNESIVDIKGADYEKIETHAYIIKATSEHVEIYLESDISTDIK